MISEQVHRDLLNWARWSWSGPWPHPLPKGRAASAEGHWIPPSDLSHGEEPPPPPPINRDRAVKVQEAYDNSLGHAEKAVLKTEYVLRGKYMRADRMGIYFFDRQRAARATGLPVHVYEGNLLSAARIVGMAVGD